MKSEELKIKNYGFTLVEIILVLAITFIVATIIVVSFSRFSRGIAIGNDVQNVVSFLEKARSNTVASRNGLRYGVHFESGKAVLFSGDTYIPNSPLNEAILLSPNVSLSVISFASGGNDLVFNRLTGETDQFGYVALSVVGGSSDSRQINISSTGVVNIQ